MSCSVWCRSGVSLFGVTRKGKEPVQTHGMSLIMYMVASVLYFPPQSHHRPTTTVHGHPQEMGDRQTYTIKTDRFLGIRSNVACSICYWSGSGLVSVTWGWVSVDDEPLELYVDLVSMVKLHSSYCVIPIQEHRKLFSTTSWNRTGRGLHPHHHHLPTQRSYTTG